MSTKLKKLKKIRSVVVHLLVFMAACVMIYPVLWMLSSSLKEGKDIFVNAHQLIPTVFTFDNYIQGFKGYSGQSFNVFFKNSLIVTLSSIVGTVLSCTVVAYGFARIHFKGAAFCFACMMMTMMLPAEVLTIPQYIFFQKIGWVNTFAPLIIPAFFGSAFFIFLLVQFIRGLPHELDESARVDGCGHGGILLRIMLPLLLPPIITVSIFKFYWTWDDFFSPLLYLTKPETATVALALKNMSDNSFGTSWGQVFAMSILSLAPVFLIFLVLQKYIVEGISTTGMKG